MIKGHVAIELHHHGTGEVERIEGDNIVTDAMKYVINNCIPAGVSISKIMPLCENVFGGLMLFDGPLTEDKSNIFFPSEAHIVAYAGRGEESESRIGGTLNKSETYKTDTGYVTTWDFSTSQANGTIRSIALTYGDPKYVDPFIGYIGSSNMGSRKTTTSASYEDYIPLCYDTKKQLLYFIGLSKNEGFTTSYTRDDYDDQAHSQVYNVTCNYTIYKEYMPTTVYELSDTSAYCDYAEEVSTFSLESKQYDSYSFGAQIANGYDGYAYFARTVYNNDPKGDAKIEYWKIKVSDYSFDLSDRREITARGCHIPAGSVGSVVKGYAYFWSDDNKSIYIINLGNPVDIIDAKLPDRFTYYSDGSHKMVTLKNGGVRFSCKHNVDDISGHTTENLAICYPDGRIVIDDKPFSSYSGGPASIPSGRTNSYFRPAYRYISDNLLVWGHPTEQQSASYDRRSLCDNYLGTVFNLGSPIIKTAASSLKVVYTLTNVEE